MITDYNKLFIMYRLITDVNYKVKRPQNPRFNANIFEILTFSWIFNLFKKGQSRDLEENDLYETLDDHKSSLLGDELEKVWKSEVYNAYKENRIPSLLRALFQLFGAKYIVHGLVQFLNEILLKTPQPLFIGGLLVYFSNDGPNKVDVGYAYFCASGLLIIMLLSMVIYHSNQIETVHFGMKIRVACCSIIYRKALCINHTALGKTTIGHVINLLSNDVNRFDSKIIFLQYLWIGPLQTIVVTYLMWREIGITSLIGVSTFLFFIPFQGWLGKKMFELRLKTAIKTDERLRLMNEIISAIQLIKMYSWEKPFEKLIEYARMNEIQQVRRSSYIRAISLSFIITMTRLQLFVSFLSYILLGYTISSRKVFVITAYYNILAPTMAVFFNQGLSAIPEMLVSIKRIQNFLLLEEKDGLKINISKSTDSVKNCVNNESVHTNDNTTTKNMKIKDNIVYFEINIMNATAKWTDEQSSNSLESINFNAKPGELVAVIGPVGAGKSSLLQLILKELPLSEGKLSIRGKISYASQEPWLFGGSIQQNILFNSPMDEVRYKKVINVCALKNDFEQFPYGDKTFVGERGVTLSGGQRARINLARAVYKQADIYLLDDPLSAVDTRVGKHLFEKCIIEYLKNKTCILITHQIQYLTNVDQVVFMKDLKVLIKNYKRLVLISLNYKLDRWKTNKKAQLSLILNRI
uniref:Putative multidrug resistance-associated protein lethal n=1 Tax=Sipha flava TaxID=143950 RepID=A0A2S2QMV4_9HEMI